MQREREGGLIQELISKVWAEPKASFEISPTMHTDLPEETKPSHQIRL